MPQQFDAVYEDGVLKPLGPLTLADRERVKVIIAQPEDEEWMDVEFMDACAEGADPSVRLEDVRAALSKIRGSMDEAVRRPLRDVRGLSRRDRWLSGKDPHGPPRETDVLDDP